MSRIHKLVSGTVLLPSLQVELLLVESLKTVSSLNINSLKKHMQFFHLHSQIFASITN